MDSENNINSPIQVLSDQMINQIAAGEVIENPSSAVKELIENSIDAKASIINVTIKAGGMLFICVEDNGFGMNEKDLVLALRRHATSKIYSIKDLLNVNTMGFRGEALASIAAVSKLKIESAKKNETAQQIEVEGGQIISQSITSRTKGTTVEIKSLFFNTPVRKKFQKTQRANIAAIVRIMMKIALSYPKIGFTLLSDGQIILKTNNYQNFSFEKALENTAYDVLGKEFIKEMAPINFEENFVKLVGYIGHPSLARKTRGSQYLLINKRVVFSPVISKIINEGYGTRLSDGFFPSFVLHLNVPYEFIDVNVHPQKKEIRLREEIFIKEKLIRAVSFALQLKNNMVEKAPAPTKTSFLLDEKYKNDYLSVTNNDISKNDIPKNDDVSKNDVSKNDILKNYDQQDLFLEKKKYGIILPLQILGMIGKFLFIDPATLPFIHDLIEKGSIAIVDIEAAYCRCLFDAFLSSQDGNKTIERQSMNIPRLVDVSPDERIVIEDNLHAFYHMGLEIRFVSENTVAIDTLPTFVKEEEIIDIFSSILEDILVIGKSSCIEKKMHMKFARNICRFAKGRKKMYSLEEAKVIVQKLASSNNPNMDPMGDFTYLVLTEENMQKLFKKRGSI